MTLSFDHFVLLVDDLDLAVRDFQELGFTVLERADTEFGKTRFRFISFEDGSYILLTAFASPGDRIAHRLGVVLDEGEGWADWSFTVPDAPEAGRVLKKAGFSVADPVRVSNVLADNRPWALQLLMCGRGANGDVALPFLVSDVEGRAARIPGPEPHENGATGAIGLSISTPDEEIVGATLAAMGGVETAPGHFSFGKVWVEVLPLTAPKSRPGGGMVEVVLSGGTDRVFDSRLTHQAPLRMEKA